ncbi:head-tail adaptor protein [uncultured Cohaesibacter sp.]|uniref:head-tail adaptor protein n=1 Tax=uncultured Cohaesibacter sp. TaxID=1002546 RepID=UPI002AA646B8|nr:head-tail adaptor protein [uncultured Cohaesibacter sp.]
MAPSALVPFQFDPAGLRHQIVLYQPVYDDAAPWNGVQSLEQVAEVWAGLLSVDSKERTEAEQGSNSLSLRFVIRHREGLEQFTALRHKGALYDCLNLLDPDATERWLVIEARTRLGAQL